MATRQHRQGKARQHEPRVQMTYSESGWCSAVVGSRLGDSVVARLWVDPAPLPVIPNHAMAVQSTFWRVFGCKGGWLHFPLQIESLQTFSWLRKLSRGAKGLLHIHRNFLVFKIQGSLNFLTSICIYIPQNIYTEKKIQPLIFLYKEFLCNAWTVLHVRIIHTYISYT